MALSHSACQLLLLAVIIESAIAGCPYSHFFRGGEPNRKLKQLVGTEVSAPDSGTVGIEQVTAAIEQVTAGGITLNYTARSSCTTAQYASIISRIDALAKNLNYTNPKPPPNLPPKPSNQTVKVDYARMGPNMIRLAFHTCGTWDATTKTGGCEGGWMRANWPDGPNNFAGNDGLQVSLAELHNITREFPCITLSDIWTLSGAVALKALGGPQIRWYPGRRDSRNPDPYVPILSARMPEPTAGVTQLQAVQAALGLTDREFVALVGGGHTIGHAFQNHQAGFWGSWTVDPGVFNGNEFFVGLLNETWVDFPLVNGTTGAVTKLEKVALANYDREGRVRPKKAVDGFPIFRLPSDMALLQDPYKQYVTLYAGSASTLLADFAAVFEKIMGLGSTLTTTGFVYPDSLAK